MWHPIRFPAFLFLLCLCGCDGLNLDQPNQRQPLTPTGILPVQGVDSKPAAPAPIVPVRPVPGAAEAQPDAAADPAARPTGDQQFLINKTTARVVDAKQARQQEGVREVENKIQGSDPLSVATSAYVSIRSRASTLGFQAAIKQIHDVEGRWPTYEEFVKSMRENKIEFTELYPYQMYGYDADTGGIVILEDTNEKTRRYKEIGLDPEGN